MRLGLAAALLLGTGIWVLQASLLRLSHISGWLLLALSLGLSLYGIWRHLARRRGRMLQSLHTHLIAGLLSLAVFVWHLRGLPDTALEWLLAVVFLWVALSGLLGWGLSRLLLRRQAEREPDDLAENARSAMVRIRGEAETTIARANASGHGTLAAFYLGDLHDWMQGPRDLAAHLAQRESAAARHVRALDRLTPRLSAAEAREAPVLRALILAKGEKDFQFAAERMLRLWLLLHLPAAWALWPLLLLHVAAMLSYRVTA